MKLTASNVLLTTLGCVLVGGCSIFAPKRLAHTAHPVGQAQVASSVEKVRSSSVITDAGRALLDVGQPAFAINTFRKALAKGEAPGPALNGLGVAYARIGRQDLAMWYFKQAVVFDPGETRYAMNLERVTAAFGNTPVAPARLVDASGPAASGAEQSDMTRPAATGTRRFARTEIKIVTASPQAGSVVRPMRSAAVPSLAKIEFADRSAPEIKSRWVDVAPARSRLTRVGKPPARKLPSTVRMAAVDPR